MLTGKRPPWYGGIASSSLAGGTMKFVVRNTSWYKRRIPTPEPKAIKGVVPNFKLEENYFCDMHVLYDNGEVKRYLSRVVRNDIKGTWVVDGMHVILDCID